MFGHPLLLLFLICPSILRGNLAPGGSVSKITGKEGLRFVGKARAFDGEDDFTAAIESGSISNKNGEKTVVVLRYLGPKGGPGVLPLYALVYVTANEWRRHAGNAQANQSGYGCWLRTGCCMHHGRAVQWRVRFPSATSMLTPLI